MMKRLALLLALAGGLISHAYGQGTYPGNPPDADVCIGQTAGPCQWKGISGDVGLSDAGAVAIQPGAVSAGKMASGAAATNVGALGGGLTGTLPNPGLASVAAGTVKCRETGNGTGAPQDCSYPTINITDAPFGADPTGATDSTAAIQNAINALPASGGDVIAPCGIYKVSASIAVGNGTGAAGSTVSGIIFRGVGNSRFNPVFAGFNTTACVRILWAGTGAGGVFAINGPMQGWGIQNVEVDCNSVTASVGIVVTSAQFGDNRNLAFNNCFKSIGSTTVATFGSFTNTDSFHNRWYGTSIRVPAIAGAIGIVLTGGSTTSNTDYNTFIDTDIDLPNSVVAVQGVFNQMSDTNHFYNTHIYGGNASAICLGFDYTGPSSNFPSANTFYGVDTGNCGGGAVAANGGSPGGGAQPNSAFITLANSMPIPAIANLSTSNPGAWASFTPTPTCGTATFSGTTAAFQTSYKTTSFRINFTIATLGTCTSTLTWSLPNTAKGAAGFAGNNSNTGDSPSCRMSAGATTVSCNNGVGTNFAANDNLFWSGSYESQ